MRDARILLRAALLLGLAWGACAAHAGDAAAGGKVFAAECADCHSMKEGKDKKGPSLFGVVGAKSARRDGFAYSDALRASGITWTRDRIEAYVTAPKQVVPGGKMKYDGLADAHQRDDLLAFLESAGK